MSCLPTGIKLNLMKKIIYLFVVIFILQNCGEKVERRQYVLDNKTNHTITIHFYSHNRMLHSVTKSGVGNIYSVFMDDEKHGINAPSAFSADSLVIIYDDKKRQTYWISSTAYETSPLSTRSPLNDSDYVIENKVLYRFDFTEEDYENAEEI